MNMLTRNHRERARGSALIEFGLSALVWVPLLLGTIFVGINIVRAIEVTRICRDAGHMHAYGIDFSQPGNQDLLVRLASSFYFTRTGGDGVVILSSVYSVGASDCVAAGYVADPGSCANLNQCVFTRRIVVGNRSLRASSYGTPGSGTIDGNGNIGSTSYLTNTTTRANGFCTDLPLAAGQMAYLAESYFVSPDLNWSGFSNNTGVYSRAIF